MNNDHKQGERVKTGMLSFFYYYLRVKLTDVSIIIRNFVAKYRYLKLIT